MHIILRNDSVRPSVHTVTRKDAVCFPIIYAELFDDRIEFRGPNCDTHGVVRADGHSNWVVRVDGEPRKFEYFFILQDSITTYNHILIDPPEDLFQEPAV